MSRKKIAVVASFTALATGFVFMAGYAANAPIKPAVVAFIDLERIFNNLDSRTVTDEHMQAMAEDMQKRSFAMREELELLRAELESLEPGTDEMAELNDRVIGVGGRLRAFENYATLVMERERAEDLRQTYNLIREEAGNLSKERNIDIVLLNDSIPKIDLSDAARTLQQISARRVLYANQSLDITEELLARMNDTNSG